MMFPKNMKVFLCGFLFYWDLYFVSGDVSEQETWYGIEEWVLIPNTAWEVIQSETCYVVWNTVARRVEVETCSGCSLAMEVTASINYDETTCPEEIWNYAEYISWQADYEIALVGDISMFYYTCTFWEWEEITLP